MNNLIDIQVLNRLVSHIKICDPFICVRTSRSMQRKMTRAQTLYSQPLIELNDLLIGAIQNRLQWNHSRKQNRVERSLS